MSNCLRQQRGVALITALLVVAIATTAAVSISADLQREIRRTGNMINHEQAYMYALAAEDFARYGLKLDRDAGDTDHLNELWHVLPVAEAIEGGSLQGKLDDLQGAFNLNNLANKQAVDTARFQRLLEQLGLSSDQQQTLTAALTDWLDPDQTTLNAYGAEDGYYLGLAAPERPHLTANRMLSSLSELKLVKGFDDDIIQQLRLAASIDPTTGDTLPALFSALPDYTPININTAPAEVLISLDSTITQALAEQIIQKRNGDITTGGNAAPFETVADFIKYCDSIGIKNLKPDVLSVTTDYFLLTTKITIDRARMNLFSLINRNPKGISTVVSRSQGVY